MKRFMFLLFLLLTTPAFAQCTADILTVEEDPVYHTILVTTQYSINGFVVEVAKVRYSANQDSDIDLIAKAKVDVDEYCSVLIARLPNNDAFLQSSVLTTESTLSRDQISRVKSVIEAYTTNVDEFNYEYKTKIITLRADGNNSIADKQ